MYSSLGLPRSKNATAVFRTLTFAAAVALAGGIAGRASAETTRSVEAVDPNFFRVCADPSNLPFSNRAQEGFENKIAQLFAEKLGRPLVYTWNPQVAGFVRKTLNAKLCDIIIGTAAGNDKVLNTNAYYRSAYVIVYRKDSGLNIQAINDPAMVGLRIGVVVRTPPNALLGKYGLLSRVRPYELVYKEEVVSMGQKMMEDLKNGLIDVALMWGPIATWHAKKLGLDVEIVPIESEGHGIGRMDFLITMGVRKNERDWKRLINKLIRENQDEITAILQEYDVPLLELRPGRRRKSTGPRIQ